LQSITAPHILLSGGHIGFGVRPSERRNGYGAKMLALALEKCRELAIEKALVTCDAENIGSAKTIMKNGGVLESEIKFQRTGGNDAVLSKTFIILRRCYRVYIYRARSYNCTHFRYQK
jgi:predicted acetyltransferase